MADRAGPRRWRAILADALLDHDVVNVRDTITEYLGRAPTRAEITAARRAAHSLASSGEATLDHIEPAERHSARLVLGRLMPDEAVKEQFEPAAMARELARSVEVLAAAIDDIPSDQLDQAIIDQLVASVNASLAELRRIRRQLSSAADDSA